MPRAERIEYEEAYYHVMNRGRGRKTIFHGKVYYDKFLEGMTEAYQRFGLEIHAYCLMGNHYHLLVKTPRGNLSRCMRHINGLYTQRYNRLQKTDGPLFRGRYKAILIESDSYLAELSRYIHRNPIEMKRPMVAQLEKYTWSSYPAYLNKTPAQEWLKREEIYQLLGYRQQYKGYRTFVEYGVDEEIATLYRKKKYPAILGSKAFKERAYAKQENAELVTRMRKKDTDKPGSKIIVKEMATLMGVDEDLIYYGRRGQRQTARWMAMHLCQTPGGMSLGEIAETFNIKHISGVCHQVRQLKNLLEEDAAIRTLHQLAIQHLTP